MEECDCALFQLITVNMCKEEFVNECVFSRSAVFIFKKSFQINTYEHKRMHSWQVFAVYMTLLSRMESGDRGS